MTYLCIYHRFIIYIFLRMNKSYTYGPKIKSQNIISKYKKYTNLKFQIFVLMGSWWCVYVWCPQISNIQIYKYSMCFFVGDWLVFILLGICVYVWWPKISKHLMNVDWYLLYYMYMCLFDVNKSQILYPNLKIIAKIHTYKNNIFVFLLFPSISPILHFSIFPILFFQMFLLFC